MSPERRCAHKPITDWPLSKGVFAVVKGAWSKSLAISKNYLRHSSVGGYNYKCA